MNTFIEAQIKNMLSSLYAFEDSLRLAAMKDDGKISREEERQLQRIARATAQYRSELGKELANLGKNGQKKRHE